jgi:endonuclease/exonuclease/phosphatase family metal-dependent hydrolase
MKLMVHAILAILLSFSVVSSARAQPQKFITMNLHCQDDDWRWRFTQISLFIAREKPAAVFFQEVCDGNGQSMSQEIPKILAKAGYPVQSYKALFSHDAWDGKFKESIAVASLWNSVQWFGGPLPGSALRRVYLGFRYQGANFIAIHLTNDNPTKTVSTTGELTPAQSRTAQIEYLTNTLNANNSTATLYMGDFNSETGDNEQTAFRAQACTAYFPSLTEPFPNPKYSIDGGWITPHFARLFPRGATVERIFDQPIEGRYLSDHAGAMIIFR